MPASHRRSSATPPPIREYQRQRRAAAVEPTHPRPRPGTAEGGHSQCPVGGRHRAGAIQVFRLVEKEEEINGRLRILRTFAQESPAQILAALRAARQAARAGGTGYDPARHAALCRIARAQGRARLKAL